MSKVFVITTTIRVPEFLREVFKNAARFGHADVHAIVIGDRKTPQESPKFCHQLSGELGCDIRYMSIEDQKKAIRDFPELAQLIPENTAARKMIGNFIAYREGADVAIMIDDDNFLTEQDFIGNHAVVGTNISSKIITSKSGWFNAGKLMKERTDIPFYVRGFPWSERHREMSVTESESQITPVVNQGIVLEDTDVDAIARLFWPIRVDGVKSGYDPRFCLAAGTWCAFNNQNTSLARKIIPVYFTPFGTGRNADIWTSFIICALAEKMGDAISFGYPHVKQLRNPHDLWKDLDDELLNNRLTDRLIKLLRAVKSKGNSYVESLDILLRECLERLSHEKDLKVHEFNYFQSFFHEYQIWLSLFEKSKISN